MSNAIIMSAHKQQLQNRMLTTRHITSIRDFLATQETPTLSVVLFSLLDCYNSLLSGCPRYFLAKRRKVQKAAAVLICKAKRSDHIRPILQTMRWLPVAHRIQRWGKKIPTICFSSGSFFIVGVFTVRMKEAHYFLVLRRASCSEHSEADVCLFIKTFWESGSCAWRLHCEMNTFTMII